MQCMQIGKTTLKNSFSDEVVFSVTDIFQWSDTFRNERVLSPYLINLVLFLIIITIAINSFMMEAIIT